MARSNGCRCFSDFLGQINDSLGNARLGQNIASGPRHLIVDGLIGVQQNERISEGIAKSQLVRLEAVVFTFAKLLAMISSRYCWVRAPKQHYNRCLAYGFSLSGCYGFLRILLSK